MTISISTAARNARLDALVDLLDAGAGAATLKLYTGSKPATVATAVTGTLLATITCADPAFGASSSGVATLSDPAAVDAVADGTAGYFRAADSDGTAVFDGTVGATGSGADLELATTSITTGLSVDITGGTLTEPAG
jgi:hypothetical protein